MNYRAAIVFILFLLFSLNTNAQTLVTDSLLTPITNTDSLVSNLEDTTLKTVAVIDSSAQTTIPDSVRLGVNETTIEIDTTSSIELTETTPQVVVVDSIIPTTQVIDTSKTLIDTSNTLVKTAETTKTIEPIPTPNAEPITTSEVETTSNNESYATSLVDSVMNAAQQELAVMQKTKPTITQTSKDDVKSLEDIPSQIAFVVHCYDSVTKTPLEATVLMSTMDKSGKRSNGTGACNSKGYFNFSLTSHAHFEITVSFPDYVPYVEEIDFSEHPSFSPVIKKEYPLKRFQVGDVIHLENVSFKQGDFHLQRDAFPVLDNLAKMMEQNDHMVIKLKGHTDNSGSGEANLKLSQARVNEVRYYLLRRGIKLSRIKGEGYGGNHPLVPNTCPENMEKNRRVEFEVLKI